MQAASLVVCPDTSVKIGGFADVQRAIGTAEEIDVVHDDDDGIVDRSMSMSVRPFDSRDPWLAQGILPGGGLP
jgi:hypothetical protein